MIFGTLETYINTSKKCTKGELQEPPKFKKTEMDTTITVIKVKGQSVKKKSGSCLMNAVLLLLLLSFVPSGFAQEEEEVAGELHK